MGDQLRLFEIEKRAAIRWTTGYHGWRLHDLEARELAQQLAIAHKHNQKSYKRRILAEARRRGITL